MFSYKEARKYTKENISGKASSILGYAVLYFIFYGLISGILSNFDDILGFLFPVFVAAFTTPMQVGLFRIITNILNNQKVSFSMLFEDYKYFLNLFVIGFTCNLAINIGYKFLIVGILLSYIYVGVLYFFIYNSDLSIGDFFKKVLEKIKSYFSECIMLELSYVWPIILATFIYFVLATVILLVAAVDNISKIVEFSSIDDLIPVLLSIIPLIIITIIFAIVIIVLLVLITPRLLFAEAKFYSVFGNEVIEKPSNNYCSNCGAKIEGKFCPSCGTKVV